MKILKICGIPIYKMLSDTEFVEKTRKVLRYSRKLVWIHVAMLLVICVIVPGAVGLLWQLTKDSPDQTLQSVGVGLFAGFLFGVFIGRYLWTPLNAVLSALDLFDYNRVPRLLIKYHDMLKEIDALDQDDEQQDELGILRAKQL
jgi:hypothetical protein